MDRIIDIIRTADTVAAMLAVCILFAAVIARPSAWVAAAVLLAAAAAGEIAAAVIAAARR